MNLELTGEVWFWRGPSPFHFVTVPEHHCDDLASVAGEVSYGWGMIPVSARIGGTNWTTSLFPKDGGYIVPIKDKVRNAEGVQTGDPVTKRKSARAPATRPDECTTDEIAAAVRSY